MRRVLAVLALALCLLTLSVSAEAAISRIGSCAAQTTSCTFSVAPALGDVIIVFAHRDNGAMLVTFPTGYGDIEETAITSTNSAVLGVRISDGTETTTGTWTLATSVAAVIYRGGHVAPIGRYLNSTALSNSISYGGLTLDITDGTSWVVGFSGHRTATNNTSAPTNMTIVASATDVAVSDTNAGVTAWTTQSVTVNTSAGWESYTVEILAPVTGESSAKLNVDNYSDFNVGNANGTALDNTILNNANQGPDDLNTCTATGMTVEAHQLNKLATVHLRSPSTDYAVGSTTRPWQLSHSVTSPISCQYESFDQRFRGALTRSGYVHFGPPSNGVNSGLFDYWVIYNLQADYCVLQLSNGHGTPGGAYDLVIEANPGGATTRSTPIAISADTTYFITMRCNFISALAEMNVYTTAGVQVGSTVTVALKNTGSHGTQIWISRFGNNETGIDNGFGTWHPSWEEHLMTDYTAAVFPLGPAVAGGATPRMMLMGVGD